MALEGDDTGGAADLLGGAGGGEPAGGEGGGAPAGDGGAAAEAGKEGGGFVAPDWFEKVSAQAGEGETASNRDWLQAKGVKDLDGLTKIARDTEKALRENGRVKVPGDGAKPEEVAAFRAAIGVPDKVDGYEVKGPEGVPLNEPLIKSLTESALKHGAPKGAFEGLVGDFIQAQLDEAKQLEDRQMSEMKDKLAEWGGKKDANLAHIDAAARALGFNRDDMTWFRSMPGGAGRALDLLAKLGSGMAEDTLITGGKGRFGVTGAEAKTALEAMKADPEISRKILVKGSPERIRYDRLNAAVSEFEAAKVA